MQRSPSTIAGYIKDFHAHRDEIAETLAADQLVHSLAGINNPDPDLHQEHIQAARELRLQVDTLDRLTDRRQRETAASSKNRAPTRSATSKPTKNSPKP